MDKRIWIAAAVVAQCFVGVAANAQLVKFDVAEFTVEGNTLLPVDKVQSALAPFVGAGREMSDVSKAADALRTLYQDAGYSVVQVIPPMQTITNGKVVLKVVEDKIIAVDVAGNKAYSAENIRASLPVLKIGDSLNAKRLEAAIVLANENSAKQIAVNVQPGVKLGDINTRIDVTEDHLTKYVATLDNSGSASTGYAKAGFAYQNANLFDRDHALTLQYSGSPSLIDKVYSFSGGYHIPLYQYGVSVDFLAAYSNSSITTPNGANNIFFAGKGSILGARLNYALPSAGELRQKVIWGFDYKDTNNIFTGCVAPCGSITETPLSLTYFAQMNTASLQGSGSVSFLQNLGGGWHGKWSDYRAARFAYTDISAKPNWNVLRATGTVAVPLPQDWQARAQVNSQFSRLMLISAEQIGAGGAASVRGYAERVAAGDYGFVANFELYSPDLNKYANLPNGSVRALVFWDVASVSVNDQWAATIARNTNLSSVGFGARVSYDKNLSIKVDVGFAQQPLPGATKPVRRHDAAGHAAISYLF